MSTSTPVAELPSEKVKKARRTATIIALIATLGPFFYGFEGMVLNGAIKAVAGDFKLGTIAQGLAGSAGIIGGLIGAVFAGRSSTTSRAFSAI